MTASAPEVLEALRLPELCRRVCLHAGLAFPPASTSSERFVLRTGAEPSGLFAKLLEEAFLEDEAEVLVWSADDRPDFQALPPGHVAVRPGFDAPCPVAEELRRAVRPDGGRVILFAVELRDGQGRLLALTWAAIPEEEPPSKEGFRAAVYGPLTGGQGPAHQEVGL
jgi:hypothetical protein